MASSPTVPPIAIAAAAPTARVSVATAMITNIRKAVRIDLVDQGVAGAHARDGRPKVGRLVRPDGQENQCARTAPASWAAM